MVLYPIRKDIEVENLRIFTAPTHPLYECMTIGKVHQSMGKYLITQPIL